MLLLLQRITLSSELLLSAFLPFKKMRTSFSLSLKNFHFTRPTKALLLAGAFAAGGLGIPQARALTSPDGNVIVTLSDTGSQLAYSVTYQGAPVIESSRLGITVNGTDLGNGAALGSSTTSSANETFPSRHGIHTLATNHYAAERITVQHAASGRTYFLNVRAYNNGVAFRYEFTDGTSKNITAESSSFVLPANSTVWSQGETSNYENYYTGTEITSLADNTVMGPPVLVQLDGTAGYVALTESVLGVFGNPYLRKPADPTDRRLQVAYPANQGGSTGASVTGAVNTPWNVIMIGADLEGIVNNDIVETLAPAPDPLLFPDGTATSWATMGRSVWDYLRPQTGGITAPNAMINSLWASRMGFEYNTIDEGWANWNSGNPWPEVQDVVENANGLNVKILLWKRSSELSTQAQRTAFFQQLQTYGVAGFKADFFDFSSVNCAAKERIKLQDDILREAAGYQLMVNFHGTSKPTGQYRTYPNLLSFEAVFGKEQFPASATVVTVPFMRFLAGPADYTPMEFGGNKAYEIAHAINMPGPLITYAERSDRIAKSPFAALIRTIPCQWDETRVLTDSKLGETTATARRKGQDWYIGVMNSVTAKTFNIPLTFLPADTTYHADLINESSTILQRISVTRDSVLPVTITTGGGSGFVAKIHQEPTFTGSLLTGTIIGTNGSFNNSGNTKAKVFDGNTATFFDSPSANGSWAGLDLGQPKTVTAIQYFPRANWATRMINGVFQGATQADFSDAVTLATVGYYPQDGAWTSVTLPQPSAFRYVRYLSPDGGSCNVAEIRFLGLPPPATPTGLGVLMVNGTATLQWEAVTGALTYTVKRSTTSGSGYITVASNVASPNFTDPGLDLAGTYYYVVSSSHAEGEGSNSAEIQARDSYIAWVQENGGTPGAPGMGFDEIAPGFDASNGTRYGAPGGLQITTEPTLFSVTADIRSDPALTATLFQSTNLIDWTPVDFSVMPDQTGVAPGFVRRRAEIPSGPGASFFRLRLER
jgi:alpha-glucosidase